MLVVALNCEWKCVSSRWCGGAHQTIFHGADAKLEMMIPSPCFQVVVDEPDERETGTVRLTNIGTGLAVMRYHKVGSRPF